ncbi:hypothetical protein NMG60_11000061 [Bertholletia excelsa]
MGAMEGIEVILRRFGDEQSTLLDRFERLSFEVQLNQAILGRSLSEPGISRTPALLAPPLTTKQVQQGKRRRLGLHKALMKLLKPILRRRCGTKEMGPDPKDPRSWKTFSRSMRV